MPVNKKWALLPAAGILLFILLYIAAAMLYPGGSDADRFAVGFSWKHNYWCELMNTHAQNRQPNTGRPLALAAMAVLIISLVSFWLLIPFLFMKDCRFGWLIRISGASSMLVTPFLLTGRHDLVINLAGFCGCLAIIALQVNLFRHHYRLFFAGGILCILLCGLNNYVYYSQDLLPHLPVIQKITFLVFLGWFFGLSLLLYRQLSRREF